MMHIEPFVPYIVPMGPHPLGPNLYAQLVPITSAIGKTNCGAGWLTHPTDWSTLNPGEQWCTYSQRLRRMRARNWHYETPVVCLPFGMVSYGLVWYAIIYI